MIRVAICDDEDKTLKDLENAVLHYGTLKNLDLKADTFSQSADLAAQIQNNETYDIYILDMLMPQQNGIEVGQEIRKHDEHAVIIYLTSSMDFAYQAFGVFAQRYLLKPMNEAELFKALDFAAETIRKTQKLFYVNTAQGIQQIYYHEIEYVENAARALHIFAVNGEEIVSRLLRKSFENEMNCLLNSRWFIQTHKSFIVNLCHVRLYELSQMTMRSGAQIPISKSRQAQVKRAYLKYISESNT